MSVDGRRSSRGSLHSLASGLVLPAGMKPDDDLVASQPVADAFASPSSSSSGVGGNRDRISTTGKVSDLSHTGHNGTVSHSASSSGRISAEKMGHMDNNELIKSHHSEDAPRAATKEDSDSGRTIGNLTPLVSPRPTTADVERLQTSSADFTIKDGRGGGRGGDVGDCTTVEAGSVAAPDVWRADPEEEKSSHDVAAVSPTEVVGVAMAATVEGAASSTAGLGSGSGPGSSVADEGPITNMTMSSGGVTSGEGDVSVGGANNTEEGLSHSS